MLVRPCDGRRPTASRGRRAGALHSLGGSRPGGDNDFSVIFDQHPSTDQRFGGMQMSYPVVTATPAEIKLDPSPFPAEWILEGTPRACAKVIARSRDGAMATIVWSCSKGGFRWHYSVDEMLHIIAGEVFILDQTGPERRLGPGDTAFFSAGSSVVWRVTQDVRKISVWRVPVPRPVGFALRVWNRLLRTFKAGSRSAARAETAAPTEAVPSAQARAT